MSNTQNMKWLEFQQIAFDEAFQKGDWAACKEVIRALRLVGFRSESQYLANLLPFHYEEIEQPEIPVLAENETEAPRYGKFLPEDEEMRLTEMRIAAELADQEVPY